MIVKIYDMHYTWYGMRYQERESLTYNLEASLQHPIHFLGSYLMWCVGYDVWKPPSCVPLFSWWFSAKMGWWNGKTLIFTQLKEIWSSEVLLLLLSCVTLYFMIFYLTLFASFHIHMLLYWFLCCETGCLRLRPWLLYIQRQMISIRRFIA